MDQEAIAAYISSTFPGTHPVSAWGETAFFFNPGRRLPRGVYFATLKDKDGDHDRASRLYRPGAFRLNIGIGKSSYRALFGPQPGRPASGGVVDTAHDFAALDTLMPHPVYGWMSWACVLSPSAATFETVKPLLAEAHALAALKFARRT
jgi:hypothetical protein